MHSRCTSYKCAVRDLWPAGGYCVTSVKIGALNTASTPKMFLTPAYTVATRLVTDAHSLHIPVACASSRLLHLHPQLSPSFLSAWFQHFR